MRFLCFGPRMSWRISKSLVKTRSTGGKLIFGEWSKVTEVHHAVKQSKVDHLKAGLIAPSKLFNSNGKRFRQFVLNHFGKKEMCILLVVLGGAGKPIFFTN